MRNLRNKMRKNLKSFFVHSRFIIYPGLLFIYTPIISQQYKDTVKNLPIKHKIVLVPFKPTMFMDAIGKAVNSQTHLDYNQLTEAFRYRMDLALYNTFKPAYSTISLLQTAKPKDTTLGYIYNSIGYSYDLLPNDSSSADESHAEFDPKQQKKHFINNGQLQVPMDYSKRFMNVHISNPQLLPYMNKKYSCDIVVFINEVDIKNVSNTATEDLTQSNYRRQITVQYSIVDMQKHYLAKGILTTYFPYKENDPKAIGEKYFTVIAHDMLQKLINGLQKKQVNAAVKKPASH